MDLRELSVVVLCYNRREEVERTIPALCRLRAGHGFQLVVVDNASTDGSREALRALAAEHPGLELVLNEQNLGGAGGRNSGWRRATGRYILSIDEDITIGAEQMRAMCERMDADPRIGVLSPRIRDAASGRIINDVGEGGRQLPSFYEACHLIRREAMEVVGYGDPECFAAGEGFDYTLRMHAAGYIVYHAPEVVVVHRDRVRQGGENAHRRRLWVETFTGLYFKHFPLPTAVLFTTRYLVSQALSGARVFGIGYAATLPRWALAGARGGWRRRAVVPHDTVAFYTRPDHPRDFGNQPLLRKAVRSLRARGRK
ncbi:MAG TPA: glycosyltransferase [Longimicrobium sp.]|jgi:GT2 family glycosyltransferase